MTEGPVVYVDYKDEHQLPSIEALMTDLSEPYSIIVYRYFLQNWPQYTLLAIAGETTIGVIICQQTTKRSGIKRGYIGMLAVEKSYRKRGIGRQLVVLAVGRLKEGGCDEIVLETETTNTTALLFYQKLGFFKTKLLSKYYLNGATAFRLKLNVT